jgi:hypothetical protein
MPQQTSVAPVQSVSAWQSFSPSTAFSQTICEFESDVRTHAWPIDVSQTESLEQNFGQLFAL